MRSSRTAPARSPQGRGEQGTLGAEMACRLPTAARTLRTSRSAMFARVPEIIFKKFFYEKGPEGG